MSISALSKKNSTTEFQRSETETRIRRVYELIQPLIPGRVLDIGCSDGQFLRRMTEFGWDGHGIDVNANRIASLAAEGLDVRYCDLACEPLPYNSSYFDLVFAGEVIEHLVDTDAFLKELKRCLKPGRVLILTTPNLASFENRIRLLFGYYPEWVDWGIEEGVGHVRAYTRQILDRQLRKHGFTIERVLGNFVPLIPQCYASDIDIPLLGYLGRFLPSLSQGLIFLARKPPD